MINRISKLNYNSAPRPVNKGMVHHHELSLTGGAAPRLRARLRICQHRFSCNDANPSPIMMQRSFGFFNYYFCCCLSSNTTRSRPPSLMLGKGLFTAENLKQKDETDRETSRNKSKKNEMIVFRQSTWLVHCFGHRH